MKNLGVSQIRGGGGGSFMMPPSRSQNESDEVIALRKRVEDLETEVQQYKLARNSLPPREVIEAHQRRMEATREYLQTHNLKSVSE